jgi:heme A synthase
VWFIVFYTIVTLLVVGRLMATGRYGWKGLASALGVELLIVLLCAQLFWLLWDAPYARHLAPSLQMEDVIGIQMTVVYLAINILLAAMVQVAALASGYLPPRGTQWPRSSR